MDDNEKILTDALKKITNQFPNEIATQIKTGSNQYKTYTYQEFYDIAKTIGNYLIANEVKPNDKIALILENRPEWGMIYFGVLLSGAVVVPIDTQTKTDDLKYYLEHSESKIIFTTKKIFTAVEENLPEIFESIKIITLDANEKTTKNKISFSEIISGNQNQKFIFPELSPNNTASILYTSGTTEKPKGVMLTHKNFYSNFASINKINLFTEKQNILSILPLHHSFPFMATLLIPLLLGHKITYLESLKSNEIIECMQETKVTALIGVPQLFNTFYTRIYSKLKQQTLLFRLPLFTLMNIFWLLRKTTKINWSKTLFKKIHQSFGGKIKFLVSGGAKLDTNTAKLFLKLGFDLYEGYGLTETAPIAALNLNKLKKIDSAGTAIPDVTLRINDPNKDGIGEILIKGPNIMLGYFKNEAKTHEVLQNNWFYSGDLGYLDNDNYLYITARKKELIVLSSGRNISPEEVESHYSKSMLINEICILNIKNGAEEKIMAVIVPNLEYFKKNELFDIYGEIKWDLENLSKELPSYKRIMGFIITKEELARTRLGKLKRYEIKDKYLNELLGIKNKSAIRQSPHKFSDKDLALLNTELATNIIGILQKELDINQTIFLDDHLEIDLGIESLKMMELISLIEQYYRIRFTLESVNSIETIRDLIKTTENLINLKRQKPSIAASSSEHESKYSNPENIDTSNIWHNLLHKDLNDKYKKQITEDNFLTTITTTLIYFFLQSIYKIFWHTKIIGTDMLPKNEPFILCVNHNSFLDGFIIATSLPKYFRKKTFFLGIAKYFKTPIIRNLIKITKVIPIDPGSELITSLQASAYFLKNQKIICIFPEGARSIDGKLKEFKNGVGILAKELNVKLVPVYIKGSFEAWPRNQHLPKSHAIQVIFGAAQDPAKLINLGKNLGKTNDYDAITAGIHTKILEIENSI